MDEYKCEACDKKFGSSNSYDQHNQSKHKSKSVEIPKRKFKLSKKYLALALVIVASLGITNWAYSSLTGPGQHDTFAKCLTENDVKFFGAFWCPHCAQQKALFGKSMKFVNYVECSTQDRRGQTPVCIEEDISSYPTWEFGDGTRQGGVLSLQQLSQGSGCSVS